jgi:uncharacterized protein
MTGLPLGPLARRVGVLAVGLLAWPAIAQDPARSPENAARAEVVKSHSVEQALREIELRHFVDAASELTPLAEAGDAEAQFLLGLLNEAGALPESSQNAAAIWYAKAAASGNAKAQNNLGAMYYDGRGVARNRALALTWYGRAAELGNPQAQLNYALILGQGLESDTDGLINGPGRARDPAGMMRWLLRASEQGYARAQLQLGKLYLSGGDFPADLGEAAYWLRLAAAQDLAEAQYLYAVMLQKGEGVPRDLVAAIGWFERASSGGHAAASYELGSFTNWAWASSPIRQSPRYIFKNPRKRAMPRPSKK